MKDKVLFITAFPPSNIGAAVKNTKTMLMDLSTRYEIDLIYFKEKDSYVAPNLNIQVKKAIKISTLRRIFCVINYPFLHPFFTVRFRWSVYFFIKKLIAKNRYKVIICDHSQVFLYAKLMHNKIPKLLICHDIISQRVSRTSNTLFMKFATISEKIVLNTECSKIFTFSQKDCDLVRLLFSRKAYLCLIYVDILAENAIPSKIGEYFVFFAYWGRPDNYNGLKWFYKNVVPLITKETSIIIIGKDLDESIIKHDNTLVETKILGFVDNPYEIIANAKAVLSPLFSGAGIKVKVIESLACGTPVLGTNIAFEGFDSKFKDFMILCETPDDYLQHMYNINFVIEKRRTFKHMFLESFRSKTMLNYIDEL